MPRRIARHHLPSFSLGKIKISHRLLFFHILTTSFLVFGDGIIAYSMPVSIELVTNNLFILGLIMGFSSLIGLITDFLLAEYFPSKEYVFFAVNAFKFGIVFGLCLVFLPHTIATFLLAVAIWGIYFELTQFSHFNIVRQFMQAKEHAMAWGWIEAARAITFVVSPIIASWLLSRHTHFPFITALALFSAGFLLFRMVIGRFQSGEANHEKNEDHHSFAQELKIWRVLIKRVWHLYFFYFVLVLLDMSFWSVGVILSEDLKSTTFLGALLIPAYIAPSLFTPRISQYLAQRFSKKRVAFYTALAGSTIMLFSFMMLSGASLIGGVFLGSIGLAIAWPQTYAVFEDYVDRLGLFGEDMIGLERSAANLAAIVGPVTAGGLAAFTSPQVALGIFTLLVLLVCIISLEIVPRKIRMPQKEVQQVA